MNETERGRKKDDSCLLPLKLVKIVQTGFHANTLTTEVFFRGALAAYLWQ